MNEFNGNKKNPFEHKLTHFQIFWIQKLTLWARDTISATALSLPDIILSTMTSYKKQYLLRSHTNELLNISKFGKRVQKRVPN